MDYGRNVTNTTNTVRSTREMVGGWVETSRGSLLNFLLHLARLVLVRVATDISCCHPWIGVGLYFFWGYAAALDRQSFYPLQDLR